MKKRFFTWGLVSAASLGVGAVFINMVTPDFPRRNVDTRTIQYIKGSVQTTSPHLPSHDFSLDGRIALRLKGYGSSVPFYVLTPEKINHHLKHPSNAKVGANLMTGDPYHGFSMVPLSKRFPKKLGDYSPKRSILCEKTEQHSNPYACNKGKSDCYKISVISRFHKDGFVKGQADNNIRYASQDVLIQVNNPKTKNARIASIKPIYGTEKIGPNFNVPLLAEPVIVGDGRLLITRVNHKSLRLTGNFKNKQDAWVTNANIVYSVYDKKEAQCDPSKWNQLIPIVNAHYDTKNNMKNRYKFARYPFRDSLGDIIPRNGDLGGSYPWMDKGAANLFFTAIGKGNTYYNEVDSIMKGIYQEAPDSRYYFVPRDNDERKDVEAGSARTAGISIAGFWTYGKTVLFDGLLNNSDYNFGISSPIHGDSTRKLKLYKNTPKGQFYEKLGMAREIGNDIEKGVYHKNLSQNSSFLGSIENRFNYIDAMMPVTQRDVVWHFGSSRHTEELVFDDYSNPHFLINADMTGAIGFTKGAAMRHYDGINKSKETNALPHQLGRIPLLFQNASTAPAQFLTPPKYGYPLGDLRLEPISKGGIYGKGLWLEKSFGLSFDVPQQKNGGLNIAKKKNWFVSLFLDPRKNSKKDNSRRSNVFHLSSGKSVKLYKSNAAMKYSNLAYDYIELWNGNKLVGRSKLARGIWFDQWSHLAIQFRSYGKLPQYFQNGFLAGEIKAIGNLNNFFTINSGTKVTLGNFVKNRTYGLKGWVDEFKVLAGFPTLEEKCNYGRGILVKVQNNASKGAKYYSSRFPASSHELYAKKVNENRNSRYMCFTRYGNYNMKNFTTQETIAHRLNIPKGLTSYREKFLFGAKILKYNKPRPNFTQNQFCMGCHLPRDKYTFRELDMRALTQGSKRSQYDQRRQPMQPPQRFRGVIPAHYFGKNRPMKEQVATGAKSYIDYWVLPR